MATGRVPTTANSPLTAKGDLFGYSTTQARVAVGNDGETLVADSSTSTGLRYQGSQAAGRNAVINGGFDIWQRGTSLAVTAGSATFYGPDRWQIYSAGAGRTVSRQLTNDATNLPFIQYCMRVQRDSGNTATNFIQPLSMIETVNTIPFAGRTIVISFYARAGANFSGTSNILGFQLVTGTGTDQNVQTGYTGVATPINTTVTLTTTWQRFSFTTTLATSVTEMSVAPYYTPTGTAGANDWFEITGVQLELGSVPTQFSRTGGTIQGELAACQRYYYRELPDEQGAAFGTGILFSSSAGYIAWRLPVTMRVKPTLSATSTASNYVIYNVSGSYQALTAVPVAQAVSKAMILVYAPFPATGGAAGGQTYFMTTDSGINGYLAASAEL
jgi:hypothetical protein